MGVSEPSLLIESTDSMILVSFTASTISYFTNQAGLLDYLSDDHYLHPLV